MKIMWGFSEELQYNLNEDFRTGGNEGLSSNSMSGESKSDACLIAQLRSKYLYVYIYAIYI